MGRKRSFHKSGVVTLSFYVQFLLINIISSFNKKLWVKIKFSASIDLN